MVLSSSDSKAGVATDHPVLYLLFYCITITMRAQNKTRNHARHGTQCVIENATNRNPTQSLQENSITVFGLRLFDSLPKYLRDIEIVQI